MMMMTIDDDDDNEWRIMMLKLSSYIVVVIIDIDDVYCIYRARYYKAEVKITDEVWARI